MKNKELGKMDWDQVMLVKIPKSRYLLWRSDGTVALVKK